MKIFGFTIYFQRQSKILAYLGGYTSAVKGRAPVSKISRLTLNGQPSVLDPMGDLRGSIWCVWFRPLGWTITVSNLKSTTKRPKGGWRQGGIIDVDGKQVQCSGSN